MSDAAGQNVLVLHGLDDPNVSEFIANPDWRTVAAFFLGWVFTYALQCIARSPIVLAAVQKWVTRLKRSRRRAVDALSVSEKTSLSAITDDEPSRAFSKGEYDLLVITLSIGLACASLGYFASLLTFSPSSGSTACAFVIAWGSLSSESARVVGLFILSLELRKLGAKRWESILMWFGLVVAVALILLNTALAIGVTKPLTQLNTALCYRRHLLGTSLAISSVLFTMDIYTIIRLNTFITPAFLRLEHQISSFRDLRVARAFSLMLAELLVLSPMAQFTNILTDTIPFTFGALIMLVAFNTRAAPAPKETVWSTPSSFSKPLSRGPSVAAPSTQRSAYSTRVAPSVAPVTRVLRLTNPSPIRRHSISTMGSHETGTMDTPTAEYLTEAVVQVASRNTRVHARNFSTSDLESGLQRPVQTRTNNQIVPSDKLESLLRVIEDDRTAQWTSSSREGRPNPKGLTPSPRQNHSYPDEIIYGYAEPEPEEEESPGKRLRRSMASVVFGSDIVRAPTKKNMMRSHTINTRVASMQSTTAFTLSPRESLLTSPSNSYNRPFSWASTVRRASAHHRDTLSALAERSGSDASSIASRSSSKRRGSSRDRQGSLTAKGLPTSPHPRRRFPPVPPLPIFTGIPAPPDYETATATLSQLSPPLSSARPNGPRPPPRVYMQPPSPDVESPPRQGRSQ